VPFAIGGAAVYDHYVQADSLQRSLRTLWTGIAIAVDYKWTFKPEKTAQIAQMHERVANRLNWLCTTNAGLYIVGSSRSVGSRH
jgi:aarF domain-containing kinase